MDQPAKSQVHAGTSLPPHLPRRGAQGSPKLVPVDLQRAIALSSVSPRSLPIGTTLTSYFTYPGIQVAGCSPVTFAFTLPYRLFISLGEPPCGCRRVGRVKPHAQVGQCPQTQQCRHCPSAWRRNLWLWKGGLGKRGQAPSPVLFSLPAHLQRWSPAFWLISQGPYFSAAITQLS